MQCDRRPGDYFGLIDRRFDPHSLRQGRKQSDSIPVGNKIIMVFIITHLLPSQKKGETMAELTNDVPISPEKKRDRRRTLFALSFGYFIDQGEAQAMSVLFPTLQKLWGLS